MQVAADRSERGVALAETVLMMSFIMLVLYALVQTGMSSFYQVSADGASFVGGHTAVQNDPNGTGNGATVAAQVAENIFQGVGKATVSLIHPTTTTTETDISFNVSSFGDPGQLSTKTLSREVETSADSGMGLGLTQSQPPNGSIECITSKVNAQTGQLTTTPIVPGVTAGTLTVPIVSAANSIAGSVSITPQSIAATFGDTFAPTGTLLAGPPLDTVAAAQAAVSNNLSMINQDVTTIGNTPVLGSLISTTITGLPVPVGGVIPGGVPAPNSLASMISGQSGDLAAAIDGTLNNQQIALLQSTIGSSSTGLIAALSKVYATVPTPALGNLIQQLGAMTPDFTTLDKAEAALAAQDATVANTVCPSQKS